MVAALRVQVASVVQQYHGLEADLKTQSETSRRVQSEATQQGVALEIFRHSVDKNVLNDKLWEGRLHAMTHSQSHAGSTEMPGEKHGFDPETMKIQTEGTLGPRVDELETQMANVQHDVKGHLYSKPPLYRDDPVPAVTTAPPVTNATSAPEYSRTFGPPSSSRHMPAGGFAPPVVKAEGIFPAAPQSIYIGSLSAPGLHTRPAAPPVHTAGASVRPIDVMSHGVDLSVAEAQPSAVPGPPQDVRHCAGLDLRFFRLNSQYFDPYAFINAKVGTSFLKTRPKGLFRGLVLMTYAQAFLTTHLER